MTMSFQKKAFAIVALMICALDARGRTDKHC